MHRIGIELSLRLPLNRNDGHPMTARSPYQPVLDHASSVSRHREAFHEFRNALKEAVIEAQSTRGYDWQVSDLTHDGDAFSVAYAGEHLRYTFHVEHGSSPMSGVLELYAVDRFDTELYHLVGSERFSARGKTEHRYWDDEDELFINRPAGARDMLLLQLLKRMKTLGQTPP